MAYFDINVSLNGQHYFATAPRSAQTQDEAAALYAKFRQVFPVSKGYEISVTRREEGGMILTEEFERLYNAVSKVVGKGKKVQA